MLSPLDDYPVHQTAAPVREVATSDRNFYDRYYFNCGSHDGDTFLVLGLGQYPNLGTADAFALLRRGTEHRVVRASRELGTDRSDTSVGPFRVEVVEGLKKLRFVLEPNDLGLSADLTFEGAMPATLEPRQIIRGAADRVIIDACRLAQTGRWSGTFTADGQTTDVTPDRWWGTRDRSWGIRPVGEPEPAGRPADFHTLFWLYLPIQFEDHSVIVILQEDEAGGRSLEEALLVWPAGTGKPAEQLGRPDYTIEFHPGTRVPKSAAIRFTRRDDKLPEITAETLVTAHLGVGTGYGFDPGWKHGMYQGALKVDGETVDTADPAQQGRLLGITDTFARFTRDGQVGYGLFELLAIGPHRPTGLTGFL
ncbi:MULTISPECIES: hypothetical protein [unclassified Pseudofrankia]|uniref:hypothetical protein n=1 Tax=unclassified Pseudofrankia TaxID=2994372 RepID=UPI0008D90672|nr:MULTISPECIES: hypothetical protein [unclassified Pseudofrankia]MDT3441673.1 hypothetical protein [Pseudofrankia sp. BMG5.37]OHV50117.1 hypothetical protein BCD48_10935 [Pseudofrankia sp. BMG5.36]